MAKCTTSVTPIIIEDPCEGNKLSTNCIIHDLSITYLQLPANSTLTEVLTSYLLSLSDARSRITELENIANEHENRITALENA